MRILRSVPALAALVAAASIAPAQLSAQACTALSGNLVTNCSFEDDVLPKSWDWVSTVNGWQSNGTPKKFELWRGHDGFTSAHGSQHLELDVHDANSNSTIWQYINTVVGQEYTVAFSVAHRAGGAGQQFSMIGALIDDVQRYTTPSLTTHKQWTTHSFTFVAQNSSTKLGFQALGTQNSYGDHLDNIGVVSTVPEPSTYALMGAGLLAMGVVARRRRSATQA